MTHLLIDLWQLHLKVLTYPQTCPIHLYYDQQTFLDEFGAWQPKHPQMISEYFLEHRFYTSFILIKQNLDSNKMKNAD